MNTTRRRSIFTNNSNVRILSNTPRGISADRNNVDDENGDSDDNHVHGDHEGFVEYHPNLNDILPIDVAPVYGTDSGFYNENLRSKQNDDFVNITNKLESLRHEFDALSKKMEETVQLRTSIQSNMNIILDENLQKHIKRKIQDALKLYDADKVGMIDYALESAGASIFSLPETKAYPSRVSLYLGLINMRFNSNPRTMITPGTQPGQCFAFYGQEGRIRITLTHSIQIHSVTIEHAYKNLLDDQRSTPKLFAVYGLNDPGEHIRGDELGKFVYQLNGNPLQTFIVDKRMNWKSYAYVELHILTNYGHPEYTCVYRFRVHGTRN